MRRRTNETSEATIDTPNKALWASNDGRQTMGVTRWASHAAHNEVITLIIHRLIDKGFTAGHAVFLRRLAKMTFKYRVHILQ